MATGTAGTNARRYHHCMTHYIRKAISYANGQTEIITCGTVPAGSLVLRAGVYVTQVFNNATTNTVNLGTVADPDGFATALALGTIGLIPADELATSNDLYCATDTVLVAQMATSGTAATTGQAIVYFEFITDNDG